MLLNVVQKFVYQRRFLHGVRLAELLQMARGDEAARHTGVSPATADVGQHRCQHVAAVDGLEHAAYGKFNSTGAP